MQKPVFTHIQSSSHCLKIWISLPWYTLCGAICLNLAVCNALHQLWCCTVFQQRCPDITDLNFLFFLIKTETPNNSVSKVPETNALDWLMQQWNVHKVREDFREFQLRWSLNKWVLRLLRKMASDSAVLTLVGLCSTTEVLKQWRVVTLLRGHCLL